MSDLVDRATTVLTRLTGGDEAAADELTPLLYEELRALASSMLASERRDHTLQATALVNEAYMRLIDQRSVGDGGKAAFMGLAATMMRRILVDHARAKNRLKRGGGGRRVVLSDTAIGTPPEDQQSGTDVEALDAALTKLAGLDERKARLVELRFFCGLDEQQAAEIVGISRATASREWRMARSWLATELEQHGPEADG